MLTDDLKMLLYLSINEIIPTFYKLIFITNQPDFILCKNIEYTKHNSIFGIVSDKYDNNLYIHLKNELYYVYSIFNKIYYGEKKKIIYKKHFYLPHVELEDQIIKMLTFLISNKIICNDIKPENMLIKYDIRVIVRLTDIDSAYCLRSHPYALLFLLPLFFIEPVVIFIAAYNNF